MRQEAMPIHCRVRAYNAKLCTSAKASGFCLQFFNNLDLTGNRQAPVPEPVALLLRKVMKLAMPAPSWRSSARAGSSAAAV